nr:MAG TPA: Glycine rich protein [Caudoviricetes sp.]
MAGDVTTIAVGITFSTKPAVLDLQVVITDKGTGNSTVATLDDDIYESSSTLYNAVITFAESGIGVTITVSNTGFRTVTIEQSGYAKDVDVTLEDNSTNSIFSGSQKIASVFYGSQKIAFVFHGGQFVFGEKAKTFNVSSGTQSWVVPNGVKSLTVDCVASKGANSDDNTLNGGNGGRVQCTLAVTSGQTLYFTVGAIPANAATVSYNASDIRIGGTEYSNRVLIAGGGGSAAWRNGHGAIGGAGGGTTGGTGVQDTTGGGASPGQGGTQSAGGAGGNVNVSGSVWGSHGGDGQLGLGGTSDNHGYHFSIGGVGGAGYYGGGGGAGFHTSKINRASGGGGGSSYTDPDLCSNVTHTQGYRNGAGYITITLNF